MIASLARKVLPEGLRPMGYLTKQVRRHCHSCVRLGPFAGMRYIDTSFGSAYLPKLLGTYERELAEVIEQQCARHPTLIIDLGAAEGYYAVGLALRNPKARVIAFERTDAARAALAEMANLNHVATQIEIRSNCRPQDLQAVLAFQRDEPGRRSGTRGSSSLRSRDEPGRRDELPRVPDSIPFILCDVEGDELFLLEPNLVPGLRTASILVETHEFIHPGITDRLFKRFAVTHHVELIRQAPRSLRDFPFRSLGFRLLPKRYLEFALSEWRAERMSWLWLKPYD